jgi:hypothetical protein
MPQDIERATFRPILDSTEAGFDWWAGTYTTDLEGFTLRLVFERLSDGDNGAIWGEARATAIAEGEHRTLIPPSRVNLMNATRGGSGWKALASTLDDLVTQVAWDEAIAEGVGKAIEIYRVGEQEQELRTHELDLGHPFVLEPFIAASGVSVLYGEGGTGKSLLALGMAVAVAADLPIFGHYPVKSGPVLYFDYEDDSGIHEERLAAIMKSLDITSLKHPIYHRKLVAKVSQSQASMRRSIHERGAVMAVLDSIGMGRGGNANTAEDTVRMFRALRSLDVPTLAIDHVSKEDKRSGEVITPYGSVYTINSARLLWGAVIAPGASSATEKYLNMKNTKANRVALHKDMAISMTYENKRVDEHNLRWLDRVDFKIHDEWGSANEPDAWDQVEHYLMTHPNDKLTIRELATFAGIKVGTVEKAVQRNQKALRIEKRGRANVYSLAAVKDNVIEMGERT